MKASRPVILHVTSRPYHWQPGRRRSLWVAFVLLWNRLWRRRLVVLAEDIPADKGVFRAVAARPSICDLLDYAVQQAGEGDLVCLFNADCLVLRESVLRSFRARLGSSDSLLVLQRGDVRTGLRTTVSKYVAGYDAFIMSRALAARLSSLFRACPGYRLGEPWWDYVFLLFCIAQGVSLHGLTGKYALLHLWHQEVFSIDAWNRRADEFRGLLPAPSFAGLDADINRQWCNTMDNMALSSAVSHYINSMMQQ